MNQQGKKYQIVSLFLLLSFLVIFLTYYFLQYNNLKKVEQSWDLHVQNITQREQQLNQLQNLIGYGGAIHHFKNYVLRRKSLYRLKAEKQFIAALSLLEKLKETNTSFNALERIDDLVATLEEYHNNLIKIPKKFNPSKVIQIDQNVKVDDSIAIEAIKWLQQENKKISLEYMKQKSKSLKQIRRNLLYSSVFIIGFIIIFLGGFLYYQRINQKKVEDALALIRAIWDNAAHALISTTLDGTITSFNSTAEKMLGFRSEELVGKQTPGIFHDLNEVIERSKEFGLQFGETIEPGFKTFVCHTDRGLKNEMQWTYVHKSGLKFPVQLAITALFDSNGTKIGYLGIAQDIRELKQKEKALKKSNDDLLNANEKIVKLNKLQDDLLATVSHDLKNPIGLINEFLLLIEGKISDQDKSDYIIRARKQSEYCLSLINDLLGIASTEGKIALNLAIINLTDLLKQVIQSYQIQFDSKRIKIHLDSSKEHFVKADANRLTQVFNNLLGNALKFLKEDDHIEVKLQLTRNEMVRVSIIDSGPGIEKSKLKKIFDKFEQVKEKDREKGFGLGLAICKNICALHGGDITVESEVGKGTTFHVTLPMLKKQAGIRENLKILLIDDSDDVQILLTAFVKETGHQVFWAPDFEQARLILESENVDLVLVDHSLENETGVEITEKLLAEKWIDVKKIVSVTANESKSVLKEYQNLGVEKYLNKPLNKKQILNFLANLL